MYIKKLFKKCNNFVEADRPQKRGMKIEVNQLHSFHKQLGRLISSHWSVVLKKRNI